MHAPLAHRALGESCVRTRTRPLHRLVQRRPAALSIRGSYARGDLLRRVPGLSAAAIRAPRGLAASIVLRCASRARSRAARCRRTFPALSPERVALRRVPLGQPPSLHRLRRRFPGVVQRLPRYYGAVRLPTSVHHRRLSLDFPVRPAAPLAAGGRGISRFPCEVLPCVLGVSDRAGSVRVSR